MQSESSSRVLIIDDYHLLKLARSARERFLKMVAQFFGTVALIANDLLPIEEILSSDSEASQLLSFKHFHVRRLGHALRAEMVEKWTRLGQEYAEDESAIQFAVDQRKKIVDTIIGKNLLPPYPLFVLHILQQVEAQTNLEIAPSAYGYIYESLIRQALSSLPKIPTLDTRYTLLSHLAYSLFSRNLRVFTEDDLQDVYDEYYKTYKVRVDINRFVGELEQVRLLQRNGSDLRFRYKYVFYFFVARYIKEKIYYPEHESHLRADIDYMSQRLYNETYANVLMFLIYLTSDVRIIEGMISHARELFDHCEPCKLEEDIAFLELAPKLLPPQTFEEGDVKHRRNIRERVNDEFEEPAEGDEEEDWYEENSMIDRDLDDFLKVNVAFKNLQILGQILRNAPGSLVGDLKINITSECYRLGLRVLTFFYDTMREQEGDFKQLLADIIRERDTSMSDDVVKRRTDELFYLLGCVVGYNIIKKVSYAVGAEPLIDIYKEVLPNLDNSVSSTLIDASIKLDHVNPPSTSDIIKIYERFGKKRQDLGCWMLRRLVIDYLYVFDVPFKIKQRVCQKLNIEMKPGLLLGTPDRN